MEEIFKKYDEKIQEILLKDPDYLKSQADKKLLEDAKIVYSKMNDEELKKSYEELKESYNFEHRKLYEIHPLKIQYEKELDVFEKNLFFGAAVVLLISFFVCAFVGAMFHSDS